MKTLSTSDQEKILLYEVKLIDNPAFISHHQDPALSSQPNICTDEKTAAESTCERERDNQLHYQCSGGVNLNE